MRCSPPPLLPLFLLLHTSAALTTPTPSMTSQISKTKPFFEKLSRIAAPMVAQSDLPFRMLCRKYGADVCYTQMFHARQFNLSQTFRCHHMETVSNTYDHNVEGGPLIVQLAGYEVDEMVTAAQHILEMTQHNDMVDDPMKNVVQGIDLNLGCPQAIARKGNYGAFLFQNGCIDNICDIIASLKSTLPSNVGVTAKIRITDDDNVTLSKILKMQEAGLDLLTVHGRTLKENKTAVKECHWDKIAMVKEALEIPVIANGGIEFPSDVNKCLSFTGCNGVMSSESLLENPALFQMGARDETEMTCREIANRQFGLAEEYLSLALQHPPLPGVVGSHSIIKSHIFKILYRFLDQHHDIRDELGGKSTRTTERMIELVANLKDRYDLLQDGEIQFDTKHDSWYRRHRSKPVEVWELTIDERKKQIQERIAKLKSQKRVTLAC